MTTEYKPNGIVTVEGDASTIGNKTENIPDDEYVGAVVSVDGEISHLVFGSELDQSALDGLNNEFGASFSKRVSVQP